MAFIALTFEVPASERVEIPAVTPADNTARVPGCSREASPCKWTLINEFSWLTGTSLIMTRAFNLRGETHPVHPKGGEPVFLLAPARVTGHARLKKDQPITTPAAVASDDDTGSRERRLASWASSKGAAHNSSNVRTEQILNS